MTTIGYTEFSNDDIDSIFLKVKLKDGTVLNQQVFESKVSTVDLISTPTFVTYKDNSAHYISEEKIEIVVTYEKTENINV